MYKGYYNIKSGSYETIIAAALKTFLVAGWITTPAFCFIFVQTLFC